MLGWIPAFAGMTGNRESAPYGLASQRNAATARTTEE